MTRTTRMAVYALTLLALGTTIALAQTICFQYHNDFTFDPGWITNDQANLNWDATTQTFHGWQSNCGYTFAYKPVQQSGESFTLEWDVRVNSIQWSAGVTLGLFDAQMQLEPGVIGDFSLVDQGYGISLRDGQQVLNTWNTWSLGIWYSNRITYNREAATLRLQTWNRSTGQIVADMLLQNVAPLTSNLNRLGVSRLFMNCYNHLAVDFNLDNIAFTQFCATNCPADLNGDGVINVLDLHTVINSMGVCAPGPCLADLNGDGRVNGRDVALVAQAIGVCG